MIRASINNPYGVFVGVVIVVIFSVLSYLNIPVQLKPEIEPPQIDVSANYPGASTFEVEDQITNVLEQELASINDLKEITSDSSEGRSRITMLFVESVDKRKALLDVVQAIERTDDLPAAADKPQIELISGASEQAILWMAVTGAASVEEKFDMVDQSLRPALLRLSGVGNAEVRGGVERRIIVQPDPDRLAAQGVTLQELASALTTENRNLRGGVLEEGERQFLVRTMGRALSLDGLRAIVIRHGPQGSITVGDVAQVLDGRRRRDTFARTDFEPSVSVSINRQSGANTVTTIKGIEEEIERFNKQFEAQGADMRIEVTNSELQYVEDAIHLVQKDLIIGSVLAAVILALFLKAGRPIVIAVSSIPISLIVVFPVLEAFDRSLNVIALAGIAFAVGLVVDDAIVALENIERHMTEFGKPARQAALDGLEEVWSAILSSTLVRIAVFIPIVLNTTEAGLLFKDIAIAIVASVLMSLVVTITVVPAFAALILRAQGSRARLRERNPAMAKLLSAIELDWLGEGVQRAYTRFTHWACSEKSRANTTGRLLLCAAIGLLFLGSLMLLPAANYLPGGTRAFIFCSARPIPGVRAAVLSEAFLPLERLASDDPRVERVFSTTGNFNGMGVVVKREFADDKNLGELEEKLTTAARNLPGFRFFVARRPTIFRIQDKQFNMEVTGDDLNELTRISSDLIARLSARTDIVGSGTSVRTNFAEGVPELAVRVDRYKTRELGLTSADIALAVESVVAGRKVSTFTDGGREYDIELQADPASLPSRDALERLPLLTPRGDVVRLDEVAQITETSGPGSVRHFNRVRSIRVDVNTRPDVPTQIALDKTRDEVVAPLQADLPPGYNIRFGEAADKLRDTYTSLIFQGLLAVVIIYLLLVALFRSFYYPLVVVITIPLAWSGSFAAISIAYHVTDKVVQFDVLGMLGLIILSGIVAANAILIIYQMLNFEKQGLSPNEALRESAATRLRPITMTVLTAVFGMLPLALGKGAGAELYRGLGLIVVGGLISSTLFTLLLVPALMSLVNDLAGRRARPEQP